MREIGVWPSLRASGTMHCDGGDVPFLFVLCLLGHGMAASRFKIERGTGPSLGASQGAKLPSQLRLEACLGRRGRLQNDALQLLRPQAPNPYLLDPHRLPLMVHVAFLGPHSRPPVNTALL